jgi:hypothetical protein
MEGFFENPNSNTLSILETLAPMTLALTKPVAYRQVWLICKMLAERLTASAPGNPQHERDLLRICDKLARALSVALTVKFCRTPISDIDQFFGVEECKEIDSARQEAEVVAGRLVNSRLGENEESAANFRAGFEYYQMRHAELTKHFQKSDSKIGELISNYDKLAELTQRDGDSKAALDLYRKVIEVKAQRAASTPDDAEFAKDLVRACWQIADLIADGDEKTALWRKIHSLLTEMKERGILAKADEQYLAFVKAELGLG